MFFNDRWLWQRNILPWLRFFRPFFLSCKANSRVQLTKTGHGPHCSQLGNFYTVSSLLILFWPVWVRIPESLPTKVVNCVVLCIVCMYMSTVLLPPGVNPIAVNKYINISYIKKYCKMGDLSDFQRGHCWCAFSWSICNQNDHFIRCIQSSSLQGYDDIHTSWEDIISQEE